MAQQIKLQARHRTEAGRNAVRKVRARGAVPAVIYGSGLAPANLEVNRREIERILSHAVGENILVELEIEDQGKKNTRLSLIQQVQHHPIRGDVLHVDFHAVSMNEEIEAEVVVEPTGEAIGVKNYGGLLQQNMRSLTIRCLPQSLPEVITVDVSHLNIGQSIHVRDVPLPTGVKATDDPDLTVFLVSEPTVRSESTEPATPSTGPEVIREKKPASSEEKK